MVALCKPSPQFTEVELSPEEHAEHAAVGGVSQRCFIAQVADGEICAYVSTRKKQKDSKPTWHISVSVGDREHQRGLIRWPTGDELEACRLLAGQGDRVKFGVLLGEIPGIVHLVEVEQPPFSRRLLWQVCLIVALAVAAIAAALAAVWQ